MGNLHETGTYAHFPVSQRSDVALIHDVLGLALGTG